MTENLNKNKNPHLMWKWLQDEECPLVKIQDN